MNGMALVFALVIATAACNAGPATQVDGMATQRKLAAPQRPDRVAGEYLLTTVPGMQAAAIAGLLAPFIPDRVQNRGPGSWLVHLGKDPGLASLEHYALALKDIRAVQPNFLYYTNPAAPRPCRPGPAPQ
jgi:hypothetical protein